MHLTKLRLPIPAAVPVTALTVLADASKAYADANRRTANAAAAHPAIADSVDSGPGRQRVGRGQTLSGSDLRDPLP